MFQCINFIIQWTIFTILLTLFFKQPWQLWTTWTTSYFGIRTLFIKQLIRLNYLMADTKPQKYSDYSVVFKKQLFLLFEKRRPRRYRKRGKCGKNENKKYHQPVGGIKRAYTWLCWWVPRFHLNQSRPTSSQSCGNRVVRHLTTYRSEGPRLKL